MTTLGWRDAPASTYLVRNLRLADLRHALQRGVEDFARKPSHLLFLGLLYPIAGIALALLTAGQNAFYLLYPLMSGFVLLGPFAAIGLYEISRRRERGEDPGWQSALEVLRTPALGSVLGLGALLAVIFIAWLVAAHAIYMFYFGEAPAASYAAFFDQVFGTPSGLHMIVVGNIVGLFFALAALSVSLFSFPLMLDRQVGLGAAVATSVRAVWSNLAVCLVWGFGVAALLLLGAAAMFMGLAIVIPVLAHATWHLYRRAIGPPHG
jgi:uncharacterized membrane protein